MQGSRPVAAVLGLVATMAVACLVYMGPTIKAPDPAELLVRASWEQ